MGTSVALFFIQHTVALLYAVTAILTWTVSPRNKPSIPSLYPERVDGQVHQAAKSSGSMTQNTLHTTLTLGQLMGLTPTLEDPSIRVTMTEYYCL